MNKHTANASFQALTQEVNHLRQQLDEANQALAAIREGTVDALVVPSQAGEQVFTRVGADHVYRILLEDMVDGALVVNALGLILFANKGFARMVGLALQQVIGHKVQTWLSELDQVPMTQWLQADAPVHQQAEMKLIRQDGFNLPVYFSISKPQLPDHPHVSCVLATDLTKHKRIEAMMASQKEVEHNLAASNRLQLSLEESIRAIASTVESRDKYTAGHMSRVGQIALAIAKQMHLPDADIHGIELASVIHDVGKIAIPVEILVKPGQLSPLEYMLVQTHVEAGYEILKNIQFPWPIADMVLQHHERMDGSGYPRGLMGDAILMGARIIAVADVVEAMSTHRPYRFVLGQRAALDEIKHGRGTLYDPDVVDACIDLFDHQGFSFH